MNTEQRSVARLEAQSDLANLRPLHDQVLVKLEEEPEQVGLIHVPKTAQNRGPRTAVVVAVGRDVESDGADDVQPGDRVLLGPDPGWELPDGHRMLRIGAVLAVLS
jgi:co-chaperonin GroES (HSP10)